MTQIISCSMRIFILPAVNLVKRGADRYPPSRAEGLGNYRTLLSPILDAFVYSQKAPVISINPAVRRSACIRAAPTGWISMKSDRGDV